MRIFIGESVVSGFRLKIVCVLIVSISLEIFRDSYVSLKVYDINGTEIATLTQEKLIAGEHSYDFFAEDLPSGVYFVILSANGMQETQKLILLK